MDTGTIAYIPSMEYQEYPISAGNASLYKLNESVYNTMINDVPTPFKNVIDAMNKFVIPLIVVIGGVGNTISFVMFLWTPLRNMSSSVYLAGLAIADIGFLISLLLSWTSWTELDLFHRRGWCSAIVYITYVCSFLSVWYVVSFTVERYIAVCYPFQRQTMCTTKRAKIVVVSLAVFGLAFYSFAAWTSELQHIPGLPLAECLPRPEHYHIVTIFSNIDTVFTLIIPFITIVLINARIAYTLIYGYQKRKLMSQQFILQERDRKAKRVSVITERSSDRQQLKVTKMLLIVSTAFLVLNLPSHAFRFYGFFEFLLNRHHVLNPVQTRWQELCQFFYYITFSVNFFLYSVCGKNFRLALTQCRCCMRFKRMRTLCRGQSNSPSSSSGLRRKSVIESTIRQGIDVFA